MAKEQKLVKRYHGATGVAVRVTEEKAERLGAGWLKTAPKKASADTQSATSTDKTE